MDDIRTHTIERRADGAAFHRRYIESLRLIERLHRQFLEVVKVELARQRSDDLNAVQALLLFGIDADEMPVGELLNRGHYLGSNVSYNLDKLVLGGFVERRRSPNDRRHHLIRLSDKGQRVRDLLVALFARHAAAMPAAGIDDDAVGSLLSAGLLLERFWLLEARP